MKDFSDKIIWALYGLFGAFLGLLIFMFALGGWRLVFTGRSTRPWNGVAALILCTVISGGWGLLSYKLRNREFHSGASSMYHDQTSAILFSKQLMVIATCVAALYFIWQLARGL
jgi:hypothetical protein